MPSGSKKRKSSKKSRTQSDLPELDADLEAPMGEEIGEASPSPKGIEGDPEAVAQRGLEGNEVTAEVPWEGDVDLEPPKQDSQMDEGAPDRDLGGRGNPSSQADEPEPEIPTVIEAEAPALLEIEGETARREIGPQIDAPLMELESQTNAIPEEIKPELESDAVPVESEPPIAGAAPDVPPDQIKPNTDIGLAETESSKSSATAEFELDAAPAPIGNDSGMDAALVEMEANTDAAPADIQPEIGNASDELMDAAPAEVELEIGKPSDADAVPYIESERNEALSEVSAEPEPELDPAETEPEAEVKELAIAAPADIEPETKEAPGATELVTDTAPKDVEAEVDEAKVEELETASPSIIEPETEEDLMERELVTDASSFDVGAGVDEALVAEREFPIDATEAQVEELETAAPSIIEPETEEGLLEREQVTDASSFDIGAEVEEAPVAEREFPIDATEAQVEELKTAAPAIIEPETEEALMETELVTDASPTDVEAEVEDALVADRTSAMDAATGEVEPEMNATSVDIEPERDTAQEEMDAFHDEAPPEIDAASLDAETDEAVQEFQSEPDTGGVELEPSTDVNPVEIEPEMSEALDETRQDEVSQAEIEAAPEPEPEVEVVVRGESEANSEDVDNSAEIEAKMELRQEPEPESKALNLAEDTSLQPLQEIKPDPEAEAIDEAKPEDDALIGTKTEERGSAETESDQQDFGEGEVEAPSQIKREPEVEGEVEAPSQVNPESEVEATRGNEVEAEGEVPLEAELESVVEAPAEVEPDEKVFNEAESDKQDLVVIEPDQSDVNEHDEQLQQHAEEEEIGKLDRSVCEDNQPSESQLISASEVPVPDEATLIDDSTPSISNSSGFEDTDKERTAIEQEPEKYDIALSATTIEGEGGSAEEVIFENQDTGANTVGNEQGAADELLPESKEMSEEQERAVDVVHDEDGDVVASYGNGGEINESSEQELGIELPPDDVIDKEESAKEEISEQVRAVDVGHGEDRAASGSAGNGGEEEVSSEQELGIKMPPADVGDVENSAKEEPPPSDEELFTKQTQPFINEEDLSMGPGPAVDEPASAETEQSLSLPLPSVESEMTSVACEPQDEAVTSANEGNFASKQEFSFESATGELESDLGEEEAVSSTVAEIGSVYTDFDDRASSVQEELPTDFPIPDCKEIDDIPSTEAFEPIETGSEFQFASEPPPADKIDGDTVFGLWATSEQQDAPLEGAGATKPAEGLHSAPVEEMPSVEPVHSLPHPEQVVLDNGKDEVHTSKVGLEDEEPRSAEAERASCEDDKVAANSIPGTGFPIGAGDELISKAFRYLENGQKSLSSFEAPRNELGEQSDPNRDKAEIHVMDSKELKEAEHNLIGGDTHNETDKAPVESEGRDMKGFPTSHQESTEEASLPVAIPAQDRALEHVNPKSAERPSGDGTLKRRTKLLDCCGMFDLLLRKN